MRALTVTEFLHGVNEVLVGVPALVVGEMSGFAIRQERWAFFSLKDEESVVECFMPAWRLQHEVADGMLVRVAGVPGVYAKSGRFRITVERLEPEGEGSLKRAFELLKQKLEREGLFAPERKRVLPRFPETIGLITSMESAAYTDFMRILRNRWGGVTVVVQDVAVQGASAVREIVEAFRYWGPASRTTRTRASPPEVLVLVRGGGSLEDLQAFNSEEVARAMFASPVPVIVGVGHERDVTIADLVADVRASTPSNAAERIVPDRRDVASAIEAMVSQPESQLRIALARCQAVIERFTARSATFAHARRARVDACATAIAERLNARRRALANALDAADRLIGSLNPRRLLDRGYSMTFRGARVVRAPGTLAVGDELRTVLAGGDVRSVVR